MPVTTGLQTVGFGSNTQIAYLVQAAAGAIDATPTWIVVPFESGEMTVQAEQMYDNSMTGDRNELAPRSGTVNGQMRLSGKFRPECFDGLLEAAAQGTWTTIGATTEDALLVGSTQRRVAWEIYHSDTDEYVRMIDTEISNFSLSLNANGEVTFDMTAIGGTELDLGDDIGTAITGATYVETTEPFYDSFNGTISLAGETGIYFSSMSPTINNQSTPLFALGSRYPFAISHGKMMGDMSLTAYYTDETIKSKYQDETSLDLTVKIMYEDVGELEDTTTFYHQIKWPSTKIISFGRPVSGEGALMDNLTVKPYKDTGIGSSFQIIRNTPA
jgi:hypothetical protein